jgi:hypothetical protein
MYDERKTAGECLAFKGAILPAYTTYEDASPTKIGKGEDEYNDLTAVLEGPSGHWIMIVNLAPRWRLYFGVAGVLILFLSGKLGPILFELIQIVLRGGPAIAP